MPAVKIELRKGFDKKSLLTMQNLVMDAVVETLRIPADDRNIRIIEYEPELFQMKPPYKILIEISMFTGRSQEIKRNLFQKIVGRIDSEGIAKKENVMIIINEQPKENWGVRGGISANEIDLGFKVDI